MWRRVTGALGKRQGGRFLREASSSPAARGPPGCQPSGLKLTGWAAPRPGDSQRPGGSPSPEHPCAFITAASPQTQAVSLVSEASVSPSPKQAGLQPPAAEGGGDDGLPSCQERTNNLPAQGFISQGAKTRCRPSSHFPAPKVCSLPPLDVILCSCRHETPVLARRCCLTGEWMHLGPSLTGTARRFSSY